MEGTVLDSKTRIYSTNVVTYDDYVFITTYTPNEDVRQHLENLNSMTFSNDDVVVASYPKSGSHWMYEIVNMLKTGQLDYTTRTMTTYGLDFIPMKELTERDYTVFGTHYYPRFLPKDFMEKRNKIVCIYRNPKDVAVSFFAFAKKLKVLKDQVYGMDDFLDEFFEGTLYTGTWLDHIREWENYKRHHPEHPILMISYEELKENLLKGVKKISDFLELDHPESFIEAVAKKCEVENMSLYKHKNIPESATTIAKDGYQNKNIFYHKGMVGNWKNVLTVQQNDRMDKELMESIKGLENTIRFTL